MATETAVSLEDTLSIRETAELMGLSRQRVDAMVRKGQLESVFDGVHHVLRRSVDARMAQQPRTGGQPALDLDGWLGTAAVAARLGITQGRVKGLISENLKDDTKGLPSQLLKGRRYVHQDDLDRYQAVPHVGGRQAKPQPEVKPEVKPVRTRRGARDQAKAQRGARRMA